MCIEKTIQAQHQPYIYSIKADSVKITNSCDTAELILENHTQTVPGFLYNKGRGRTEFRRGLVNVGAGVYVIGADTLDFNQVLGGQFYKQGGNQFGATGVLGLRDNYPLTFIQNNTERGRIDTSGHWLFNTTTDNGYLAQFNGDIWNNGTLFQYGNIKIAPVGGAYGDARVIIGTGNVVVGQAAVGIGQSVNVDGQGGDGAIGIGIGNTVNNGVGLLGSANLGVAIGIGSRAHRGVALGRESINTADNQFVCGGPDHATATDRWSNAIGDVYFGSGIQRDSVLGPGLDYTINGSGGYGTDTTGGNITIAGGKGTGVGTPGNIIFSTANQSSSGAGLQGISEKARFVGSSGNFLVNTTTDNGFKLNIGGNALFRKNAVVLSDDGSNNISVIADDGNAFGTGIDASLIAFGNVKALVGINKQNFGNIPANSLIIGNVSPGYWTTIVDYYGNPTFMTSGSGSVTINGGYNGIDKAGSEGTATDAGAYPFNIYGGRGTGAGTPGDINFYTGNTQSSGTTIHSMTNRWIIKGGTGYLSNSSNPTSTMDISNTNGYSQFRLRTSYTPSSTSDTHGEVGDFSWDDNYFYIKTSTGWKRSALSTF